VDRQSVLERLRVELYRLRDRFRDDSGALEALDAVQSWVDWEDAERFVLQKPYRF